MSRNKRFTLTDPHFDEFVFNCIVNASKEQKAKLPFDLYQHAQQPGKARSFVTSFPLEKKLGMLSYLGIQWSMWVAPPDHMTKGELKETAEKFNSSRIESVDKMIRAKSFNFTDRETMMKLVMMASNCHNQTYILNRDYAQLAEEITSLKGLLPDSVDAAKVALSEYKLLCKFCLHLLLGKELNVDGFTTVKEIDLAIFFYIFIHRQEAVELEAIENYLQPVFQRSSIFTALLRLRKDLYVHRFPATRKHILTSKGIQAIGAFLMRVTNQTFNQ